MDACILHAPGTLQFSDTVISGAVQRTKRSSQLPLWSPQTGEMPPTFKMEHCQPLPHGKAPLKRSWEQSKASDPVSINSFIRPDSTNATVQLLLSEKLRIRELRRLRQIRYRKKKDAYANSLEYETRKLLEEIKSLQQKRRALADVVPTKESVWSVATDYFRLFRYGYCDSGAQTYFVRSRMACDVVFNRERGPEAIVKHWKLLSQWFEDVEFELESLDKGGLNSLIAVTRMRATITERTLGDVLHVDGIKESLLVEKLQGQRIDMRGSMRFTWDPASRRVSSVVTQSDMLTSMLQLLGSLENVSCVFEKTFVSIDGQLN